MPTAKLKDKKPKPLTYKQLVKRCCEDRPFARKLHKLVCKARKGGTQGATANAKINRIFQITPKDIKDCCLEHPDKAACLNQVGAWRTKPTLHMLLDFSKMV